MMCKWLQLYACLSLSLCVHVCVYIKFMTVCGGYQHRHFMAAPCERIVKTTLAELAEGRL